MRPGGIGRFKPPTPVYRPCALCGRKHRMRPDGSSKTAEILAEETRILVWDGRDTYPMVPAGTFVCRVYIGRIRCSFLRTSKVPR